MTAPADWIEHRRGDRELLGWMRAVGDEFEVFDLLGRRIFAPVDWFTAERTLDELGIGYLADAYELLVDGDWIGVWILEVSTERIRVKSGNWKAIEAAFKEYTVEFPVGNTFRAVH
jgi:hypothetical protein